MLLNALLRRLPAVVERANVISVFSVAKGGRSIGAISREVLYLVNGGVYGAFGQQGFSVRSLRGSKGDTSLEYHSNFVGQNGLGKGAGPGPFRRARAL